WHMHQPYYKNLLTQEADLPWVRLHGVKDYLDMIEILAKYPKIRQTFNVVPSLIEQIEDYTNRTVKEKYLELSYKPAAELTCDEKKFILKNFFSINKQRVISLFPRYLELYSRRAADKEFTTQDYLDLQVWFNLSWIDPLFRKETPELNKLIGKARFFSEEDKRIVLEKHAFILQEILPAYKKFSSGGQIEISINPYYHPILPLLCNTDSARDANPKVILPKVRFAYPEDAKGQINDAVEFYKSRFGRHPEGMWPSEESVSEEILPLIMQAGINWIVSDEAILFKSLKIPKRDTRLLYQPHLLKRGGGRLNIVFRDRNLSDMIGFAYHKLKSKDAVDDFTKHLKNIAAAFKGRNILVVIAMDGENAWEYYANDGHDFLELLYERLSECKFIKTATISQYLKRFPAKNNIPALSAGSWIFADFGKWIGNPYKAGAWEWLAAARKELENIKDKAKLNLARKQIYIAEGSDWFWWYGEDTSGDFDRLFRMHLSNFYRIIEKENPEYLNKPLTVT
ncbi:MAG: glycoside hydrolase family 57 protein, partial [Candidatus Omnitrophota bacterium]|nr:glycoside hydrolase family 57 protein [Candidatus Omnitrophota bacterium]